MSGVSCPPTRGRRLADLVRKHGKAAFRESAQGLMDYSERRMRAEIAKIPDGRYGFEDYMEDDGIEDRAHMIRASVFVQGDEMVVDYTGSSRRAKGPINAILGVAWGAAYNAVLQLTDSTIPKNSGCFRPVRVLAPPGSVVNVNFPGPSVGGNTETHCWIANAVMGALAPGLKERSAATDGTSHSNFLFGGNSADGNDGVGGINGNCPHTPVEAFEFRHPWQAEEFRLAEDFGGPGAFRGGLGLTKTVRAAAEMTFSYMSSRSSGTGWSRWSRRPWLSLPSSSRPLARSGCRTS